MLRNILYKRVPDVMKRAILMLVVLVLILVVWDRRGEDSSPPV